MWKTRDEFISGLGGEDRFFIQKGFIYIPLIYSIGDPIKVARTN